MYTSKDKVRVVVITNHYRLEGDMHVLSGSRLTDSLNSKAKDFLAVTDASIYRVGDDTLLYSAAYLALNREAIDVIFPLE